MDMSRKERMKDIKLPCDKCKAQCCTYAPMTKREFKNIRKKYGLPKNHKKFSLKNDAGIFLQNENDMCAFLVENQCSVYDLRPKVCREYGVNKNLPCVFLEKFKGLDYE